MKAVWRRSLQLGVPIGALLLLATVIMAKEPLRWRARLVGLHAARKLPDLSWLELVRMIGPGDRFNLKPLLWTRNPYRTIRNPESSPENVAAGRELFRGHCAGCHGPDGRGATAGALVDRPLSRGGSDWALYRTISRGIPGTGMTGFRLPIRDRWRLVAFLQGLRARADSTSRLTGPGETLGILAKPVAVSADELSNARATPGNWLTYSGAYDGKRYSPLPQIHRGNVARLRLLWLYQVRGPDERLETSPLVVDGIMFLTTPVNGVLSLDAESGRVLWTYDRELPGPQQLRLCCGRVNRGLAILDSTLYLAALDAHLVALDAKTGAVRWDVAAATPEDGYSFTSAPLTLKDMVVIGSAGGEFPTRGFIDAYDAKTGQRRWRFATIPPPGSPGNESWSGNSWRTGGAPAWMTGSYDPELDLLYWGTGNPNPDFNGDRRRGDNLYSNSLLALDPSSGALRWYFQFTPHDEHDWDAAQIPVLVDIPAERPNLLVLTANKNGFYYVLDRTNGRLLLGRPFARQSWADGLDSSGRPIVRPGSAPTSAGTPVHPSSIGATNWWSPAYSPRTGLFYVQSYEREDLYFKGDRSTVGSAQEPVASGTASVTILALEARSGERRWTYLETSGPATDWESVGGLLATGGDLVFGGSASDFMAFDAVSGRRLWSFRAGGGIVAAPITYLVRGRQRVTVAAGRAVLTFGLE